MCSINYKFFFLLPSPSFSFLLLPSSVCCCVLSVVLLCIYFQFAFIHSFDRWYTIDKRNKFHSSATWIDPSHSHLPAINPSAFTRTRTVQPCRLKGHAHTHYNDAPTFRQSACHCGAALAVPVDCFFPFGSKRRRRLAVNAEQRVHGGRGGGNVSGHSNE